MNLIFSFSLYDLGGGLFIQKYKTSDFSLSFNTKIKKALFRNDSLKQPSILKTPLSSIIEINYILLTFQKTTLSALSQNSVKSTLKVFYLPFFNSKNESNENFLSSKFTIYLFVIFIF